MRKPKLNDTLTVRCCVLDCQRRTEERNTLHISLPLEISNKLKNSEVKLSNIAAITHV